MDNVVTAPIVSRLDEPVERSFERAREAGLTSVVIMGYDKNGQEFFSSSIADGGAVLWLIERHKLGLLTVMDEQ